MAYGKPVHMPTSERLYALAGYRQELTRRLGPMTSFSLSLSAMCFFSFIGEQPLQTSFVLLRCLTLSGTEH